MKEHCEVCGFSFLKRDEQPQEDFIMRFYCPGCPLSHVASVNIEIKDIPALEAACKRLGLEFVRGQQTYKWYGQSVGDYPLPEGFTAEELGKCQHAIRVPGNAKAYEIGVVLKNGKWQLVWDFYAGGYGLQEKVGENCCTLKQGYAIEAAKAKARQQGFVVQEKKQANGSIQLFCSKG